MNGAPSATTTARYDCSSKADCNALPAAPSRLGNSLLLRSPTTIARPPVGVRGASPQPARARAAAAAAVTASVRRRMAVRGTSFPSDGGCGGTNNGDGSVAAVAVAVRRRSRDAELLSDSLGIPARGRAPLLWDDAQTGRGEFRAPRRQIVGRRRLPQEPGDVQPGQLLELRDLGLDALPRRLGPLTGPLDLRQGCSMPAFSVDRLLFGPRDHLLLLPQLAEQRPERRDPRPVIGEPDPEGQHTGADEQGTEQECRQQV